MDENNYYDPLAGADQPIAGNGSEAELARAASALRRSVPRPAARNPFSADAAGEEGWLTVDVYQTPSEIVVESAVAGVDPDELDVTATPDSVSIKGERRREKEISGEDYLHQECYWGRFSRTIILPQEVDPESASVHFYRNGILTIHLPKATRQKQKKLKVNKNS